MQETTNKPHEDIVAELNKLGENFGKMMRAFWESDEAKNIQREVRAGLEQMSKHMNQAIESAKVDDTLKKAGEQVKQAWETARGPQIAEEMRKGFVDSLRRLNAEVEKMATPKPAHESKPNGASEPAAEPEHTGEAV